MSLNSNEPNSSILSPPLVTHTYHSRHFFRTLEIKLPKTTVTILAARSAEDRGDGGEGYGGGRSGGGESESDGD